MSLESDWLARKNMIYTDLKALLDLGVPVETAKRLASWTPIHAYATFADMQEGTGTPESGYREMLRLLVSRSEARSNPGSLEGAVLDAGKPYAIFIQDVPELSISQIEFTLNGSPVHTEFSTPWDYAGTVVGGDAARVSFVAGSYTVGAAVVDGFGLYTFEASFTVE